MDSEFKTTFLILEDDPDDALLIRRAFTNSLSWAFVCRNTSEARAYLLGAGMYADRSKFPAPEIFVTDVRLGEESGVQFLDWMRDQPNLRNIPVIVLTGSATPQEVETARKLGASRILQKPGNPFALEEMLSDLASELSPDSNKTESAWRRS